MCNIREYPHCFVTQYAIFIDEVFPLDLSRISISIATRLDKLDYLGEMGYILSGLLGYAVYNIAKKLKRSIRSNRTVK